MNLWPALFSIAGVLFTGNALAAVEDNEASAKPPAGTGMYSNHAKTRPRFFVDELSDDYPIPMENLLPALMRAINQLSKYPMPSQLPPIYRVPHSKIEELVCTNACSALATYRSGEGIYLDNALKPESNIFARSVLLHELVHYVQDMSNELSDVRQCERWYRREQEAYAIQKRFLAFLGSQIRVAYSAGSACDPQS